MIPGPGNFHVAETKQIKKQGHETNRSLAADPSPRGKRLNPGLKERRRPPYKDQRNSLCKGPAPQCPAGREAERSPCLMHVFRCEQITF